MLIAHTTLLIVCLAVLTAYASMLDEFDRKDEVALLIAATMSGYSFYVISLILTGLIVDMGLKL